MDLEEKFENFFKEGEKLSEQGKDELKSHDGEQNVRNADLGFEALPKPEEKTKSRSRTLSGRSSNFDIKYSDFLARTSLERIISPVYHSPVFALPIPTNSKYENLSLNERVDLLLRYQAKVDASRAQLARKSLNFAPYTERVLPSQQQSPSRDCARPAAGTDSTKLYTSRSGRQSKRKNYTEDDAADIDELSDLSIKKTKSLINNSDVKLTLDNPYIPEQRHKTPKSKKGWTFPKQRLFNMAGEKMTWRAEQMFDELARSDKKRQLQEEEITKFETSLSISDALEGEDFPVDVSPAKDATAEAFVPRRVMPPIPGKKKTKAKRPHVTRENKISPPGSPILKRYEGLKPIASPKPETAKFKPPTRDCPICGEVFLISKIEEHAATCGIEDDLSRFDANTTASSSSSSSNRESTNSIRCHICDKVLVFGTNYEVHVRQCIGAAVADL